MSRIRKIEINTGNATHDALTTTCQRAFNWLVRRGMGSIWADTPQKFFEPAGVAATMVPMECNRATLVLTRDMLTLDREHLNHAQVLWFARRFIYECTIMRLRKGILPLPLLHFTTEVRTDGLHFQFWAAVPSSAPGATMANLPYFMFRTSALTETVSKERLVAKTVLNAHKVFLHKEKYHEKAFVFATTARTYEEHVQALRDFVHPATSLSELDALEMERAADNEAFVVMWHGKVSTPFTNDATSRDWHVQCE